MQNDPIVKTDPLLSAVAKKLHGIEVQPMAERHKMVVRAAKAARAVADKENAEMKARVKTLEDMLREAVGMLCGNNITVPPEILREKDVIVAQDE